MELSILHGLEFASVPPPAAPSLRTILTSARATLYHGDSGRLDEVLPEHSVDAMVTDPPAGIGFMAKGWDKDKGGRDAWVEWLAGTLAPSFRALKPGAHGLVWALPRTSHWTALALEEAGFEIRDRVSHLFGTGFPKSLTDKSAEIPAGAGTALKPAVEDWWLVRKPLDGSVAENFAKWGTGVIWIDACRIGTSTFKIRERRVEDQAQRNGRWPAHLALSHSWSCWPTGLDDYLCPICGEVRQTGECVRCGIKRGECSTDCPVRMLDEHSGVAPAKAQRTGKRDKINPMPGVWPADPGGGASRFFYVAKGSRSEKDAGLDHLPPRSGGEATGREDGSAGVANPRAGAGRTGGARNFHPTVKSIALMRWLCRLITPPGGIVLDPFAGSGSTGVAALAEGFNFIGCEMTEEYLPILEGRIRHALSISESPR